MIFHHVHTHNVTVTVQVPNSELLLRLFSAFLTFLQVEIDTMKISEKILAAVTEQTTVIDSFLALVKGLVSAETLTEAEGNAIIDAINANKTKVSDAIVANTPAAVEPIVETPVVETPAVETVTTEATATV
jgi:hypothetical protein